MSWSQGMIVRVAGLPEGEGLCGVGRGDCRVKKGPGGVMVHGPGGNSYLRCNNKGDAGTVVEFGGRCQQRVAAVFVLAPLYRRA